MKIITKQKMISKFEKKKTDRSITSSIVMSVKFSIKLNLTNC